MSGDWKAGVDRQLGQLHDDVRKLLYAIAGSFLLLAGGGWAVFSAMNADNRALQKELADIRVNQAEAKGQLALTNAKLDRLLGERVGPK